MLIKETDIISLIIAVCYEVKPMKAFIPLGAWGNLVYVRIERSFARLGRSLYACEIFSMLKLYFISLVLAISHICVLVFWSKLQIHGQCIVRLMTHSFWRNTVGVHAVAISGADLGGESRGSGPPPPPPPLSYMKNDVMHTVIYAAFCMLPSLDLQDCTSF